MAEDKTAAINGLIEKVSDRHDADVLLMNGPIEQRVFGRALAEVSRKKKKPNIVAIVTTYGGDANVAYRIGRLFQREYKRVVIFVPSFCKSAGTLVAMSAHELVMTDYGELGPVDVQKVMRDEPFTHQSGLLTKAAMESLLSHTWTAFEEILIKITNRSGALVEFTTASDIAARIAVGIMRPMYKQVRADFVGADHRDLSIDLKYGQRLGGHSGNIEIDAEPSNDTCQRLVNDYPAHDFVIDRAEAETLFKNVRRAEDNEFRLMVALKSAAMIPIRDEHDAKVLMLSYVAPPPAPTSAKPVEGEKKDDHKDATSS